MRSGSLSGAVTLPGKSIGVLLLVFVSIEILDRRLLSDLWR